MTAVAKLPDPGVPMLAEVERGRTAVATAVELTPVVLTDAQLAAAATEVAALQSQVEALSRGRIGVEQARVIVDGLDVSRDDASVEQRQQAEALLLAKSTGEGTRSARPVSLPQLRRSARRACDTIDAERRVTCGAACAPATSAA